MIINIMNENSRNNIRFHNKKDLNSDDIDKIIVSFGKNIEYYCDNSKPKKFNDKIKINKKENKGTCNNYNKGIIQQSKRIFHKKINNNNIKNLSYKNIYLIISILILIFIPVSYMKISIRKLNLLNNEISMRIYGKTNLRILYNKNKNTPTELLIDGNQCPINTNISGPTDRYYNITMRWNYLLNNCSSMFFGLTEIIEIDLSNFDFSNVTTMKQMFYGANNIIKIDLSNSNTSLVEDMSYLFYNCKKLSNINLSNFKTSSVLSMYSM